MGFKYGTNVACICGYVSVCPHREFEQYFTHVWLVYGLVGDFICPKQGMFCFCALFYAILAAFGCFQGWLLGWIMACI